MKKSVSGPPDTDRARLSPTQADGGLFRLSRSSSRRPNSPRPASLSEANLAVHHESHHTTAPPTSNDGGLSDEQPLPAPPADRPGTTSKSTASFSRNSTNNTGSSAAGGSAFDTASPAPPPPAPIQDAWARTVLEVGFGEKAEAGPSLHPGHSSSAAAEKPSIDNSDTPVDPSAPAAIPAGSNNNNSAPPEAEVGYIEEAKTQRNRIAALVVSFLLTTKKILLHSWLNVFLVFVPAGIIVGAIPGIPPAVVFSLNAIAIIPLAGLLSYATEIVAHRMGDSIGALLNITFGNAVELIIFIALVKNEIRIVQASLLGSILANLLLILGMGFLLGGLRFREQIYNSTVTQMSACLLSLSVISLVLPTAFHASFSDNSKADKESLKISRGTSVILLLVYIIYLMFQLKSHAYMYESTPQHIIDEEATPGPAAAWLDSSSSDSSSSSSSSDSDSSGHSRDTMKKRMRRVIRGGRRRKSSVASLDTVESFYTGPTRTPSFSTTAAANDENPSEEASAHPTLFPRPMPLDMNEEAVEEDESTPRRRHRKRRHSHALHRYRRHRKRSHTGAGDYDTATEDTILENVAMTPMDTLSNDSRNTGKATAVVFAEPTSAAGNPPTSYPTSVLAAPLDSPGETRRVDFAFTTTSRNATGNDDGNPGGTAADLASSRRAFNIRAIPSLRPVAKSLAPTVFTQPVGVPPTLSVTAGPIPRVRYGIRRTNSLPDRLNQYQLRPPGAMLPSQIPASIVLGKKPDEDSEEEILSRKAAVLMLLITTGLVAACAEFMVDSINGLVATSSVGEVFIGLIILPIVGNAAEHVTAVMVAMKNKMDLAIGVAVGSSIQIALFMTPLIVILGWIIGRDMTLYFTLFETVCLFVSAFIVNFLVLDGRSNYLEGALLCTTYVIIGLVAFFYPDPEDTSTWG